MKVDITKWQPQPAEQVFLEGVGSRSDFASVQTITAAEGDALSTTGGWRFEKRKTDWHAVVDDRIVLRPQPQLNRHISYPVQAGS